MGNYIPAKDVQFGPYDRGFLMADGLYEIVRFYRGIPFQREEHRMRLERGAEALQFERTRFPEFDPVMHRLRQDNDLAAEESSTVYFQVTRGVAKRSHRFPPKGTEPTVYASAKAFKRTQQEIDRGAAAVTVGDDRTPRCSPTSTDRTRHTRRERRP
jgi:D-alanine transaminase